MRIAVSAGHHPGAQGAEWGGITEYSLTKVWAEELAGILAATATVVRVPTGGLTQKIEFVNAAKCDIAIEIHFNSDPKQAGRGSETLYCPGSAKGKALAQIIQNGFQAANLFSPNRGAKEGWYQMNPEKGPDAWLAKTNCVAVIVEPYFMAETQAQGPFRGQGVLSLAASLLSFDPKKV